MSKEPFVRVLPRAWEPQAVQYITAPDLPNEPFTATTKPYTSAITTSQENQPIENLPQ